MFNAFYGHLLFELPYEQTINKYSIYVHLQEEWKSYPSNLLFEVINVWSDSSKDLADNEYSRIKANTTEGFNYNQLQFQHQKSYVELKHEFSSCDSNWKPILYRYLVDTIRSNVQYWKGERLTPDPYVEKYPTIKHEQQEIFDRDDYYVQFIPICTDNELTNYEYSVRTNDKKIAFDAYFIPSKDQFHHFVNNKEFEYYQNGTCFGKRIQSFSGTCYNVSDKSGLLLLIPDNLDLSLTKISVNLHEIT